MILCTKVKTVAGKFYVPIYIKVFRVKNSVSRY